MRRPIRLSALFAGLLLLAVPAVWACEELAGMMPNCAQGEMAGPATSKAPAGASCHRSGQPLMDCCLAHPSSEPAQSTAVESVRVSSATASTAAPAGTQALLPHRAAAEPRLARWRGAKSYALFACYLL